MTLTQCIEEKETYNFVFISPHICATTSTSNSPVPSQKPILSLQWLFSVVNVPTASCYTPNSILSCTSNGGGALRGWGRARWSDLSEVCSSSGWREAWSATTSISGLLPEMGPSRMRVGMLNVEEQLKPTDVLGGRLDTFPKPKQQAPCSSSQRSYEEEPLNSRKTGKRVGGGERRLDSRRLGLIYFLSQSLSFPIC